MILLPVEEEEAQRKGSEGQNRAYPEQVKARKLSVDDNRPESLEVVVQRVQIEQKMIFLRHNIFRHQPVNHSFGIENIGLSKFPPLFKNVIVDLLLFDEFRTASQGGQPPRYIYIDEMQNLSIDKDCYLGKILTEGRKYSLNVILASQSIREFNASERTMLCQANHKLLFHPALLEVKYYAELLASPQHRAEISDLLRNLEVGQCVFQGPIYIGEEAKPTCAPICVNVSHLEDIASASLSKSST